MIRMIINWILSLFKKDANQYDDFLPLTNLAVRDGGRTNMMIYKKEKEKEIHIPENSFDDLSDETQEKIINQISKSGFQHIFI